MNIKQLIAATAVAGTAIVGLGAVASAEDGTYVSDNAVPGHQQTERQGKVVTHYTQELEWEGVNYDYVVNTVGDFGGDAYLNNGMIFNRIKGDDGSVTIYRIVHESHPSSSGEGENVGWGSAWLAEQVVGNGKG